MSIRNLTVLALSALAWASIVEAATTVRLPASACHADALQTDGFEDTGAIGNAPSDPSLGTGGTTGDGDGFADVPGYPGQYAYHVPASYTPARAWPVLIALHGSAGSPTGAIGFSKQTRSDWAAAADANGFIVIAPASNAANGSWVVPASSADFPTDYDVIAASLADVEAHYNVERTRRYGWGFSAGGHVMHDLILNGYNTALDGAHIAAYGVSAGALKGLACAGFSIAFCDQILTQGSRRVPVDIHIGTTDPLINDVRSDHARFIQDGWVEPTNLFYSEFVGGHTYTQAHLAQAWNNLCGFAVTP